MVPERGLRIHLLGGLEIEGVPALSIGSRKARALLRRLAVARGSAVAVEELLDVTWPEGVPVRGAEQLAVLTSRLRSTVGSQRLLRGDAGYSLLADWLDLTELDNGVIACSETLSVGDPSRALTVGRATLDLVRGPLLPEEPEALWLESERTSLDRTVHRLRLLTAEAALTSGAAWEAADHAQRCLDLDPYDEAALRLVLQALLASGRPSVALALYGECVERLRDDLGVDPAPETRAVHLELLRATDAQISSSPTPSSSAAASSAAASSDHVSEDLPGREPELAALRSALDRVRTGHPMLAVVRGPGGIGKTTLLDHVAGSADTMVLRATGDRVGGGLPLQPLLDALILALRDHVDPEGILGPDAEFLGPLLGRQPTASTLTATSLSLTTGPDRSAMFAALEALLGRLAGTSPLALLVDDAHLVDDATAHLLQHCTREAATGRLLVVVAGRPGDGPTWRAAGQDTLHLELGPLDRDAVAKVVGEGRADELWSRSGGHPLFLSELARWEGALPESVLTAVADRCAGTGEVATTLRAAAVLGGEIDVDLLSEVLDLPVAVLLDRLDDGVRQRLLVETRTGFGFAQQVFREGLAAGVTAARRTVLHRDAARGLARRPMTDPLRVAHHALQGGDEPVAADALTSAARVAGERYTYDEAIGLLDRAVALEDTAPRRLLRGRALLLAGRYPQAQQDAEEALARGEGARALELCALVAYYQRDLDRALELADAAAADATDPELAAGCRALAGRILLALGDLPQSEARLQEARELATGPMRTIAAVWLSIAVGMRGDAVASYRIVRSPETAAARTQPLVEPHRCIALGRSLAMLGRGAEAIAVFERLAETVQRQHVHRFAGRAENYRGWVLRNLGAMSEAEEATQAAQVAVGALDDLAAAEARGHSLLDLADARLRTGDLDGAARWLDEAARSELAPHVMKWRFELRRDLSLGRLALATGDLTGTLERAEAVRRRATDMGVARFTVQSELLSARAAHLAGDSVDLKGVARAAAQLEQVAPLESWWLLADLAREFDVPDWSRLAARRVDVLVEGAGPWADDLRRAARSALEGLPT